MIIDKVIRNIYGIGGAIIVSAFGISFIATKVKRMPTYLPTKEFSGEIKSISDIEDLEYTKGCRFLFYDEALIKTKFEITGARDFKGAEGTESKLIEKVKGNVNDCVKGRFFYYKIPK